MPDRLKVSGLHAHWNRGAIVRGYNATRGVSFDIAPGTWVAVIGDNGIGKSTLFHAISGTVPFVTGVIWINKVRLPRGNIAPRFTNGVLHVRQDPSLPAGDYWVKDALTLATAWRPALQNDRAIRDLIFKLGAMEILRGERCSADAFDLIACVAAVPRVVMLDEVRARVAVDAGGSFYEQLRPLVASSIVLFTEHDIEIALGAADAVLWLREDGPPTFDKVAALADAVRKSAPIEEPPARAKREPIALALGVVRRDESIRRQTQLAVKCARGPGKERTVLLRQILAEWPFLGDQRPAEKLSGGERITLVWLLMYASGLEAEFPSALRAHLSRPRLEEISRMTQLIGGEPSARRRAPI